MSRFQLIPRNRTRPEALVDQLTGVEQGEMLPPCGRFGNNRLETTRTALNIHKACGALTSALRKAQPGAEMDGGSRAGDARAPMADSWGSMAETNTTL